MADTIMTYKRGSQASNQQLRVPGSGGARAMATAQQQYIAGIDAFAKAGGKLANAYFTAIENREARDADTYASKLFRERRIEILQTVKGKDADGLVDREAEWADEQFEAFTDQYKIDMIKAKEIWRRHQDTYLDRTGAYMVEQQTAYDKQSRLAASDAVNDDLVNTAIGDIDSILLAFTKNDELFENDPALAEKQNDKVIMTAVGAWARQNPRATISWFNKNKEGLKEQFGAKFLNVSDVIDRAEAKIQAEARHAEVLAQRAERLALKRQREYSEQKFSDFLTLLARGEADAPALWAMTDDPDVLSSFKLQAYNAMKGAEKAAQARETAQGKADQDAREADLVVRAFTEEGSVVQADAIMALQNGEITTEAFNNIKSNIDKASAIPAAAKPFITDTYAMIKDVYGNAPAGMMLDPQSLDQYNKMRNAVTERALNHPESVAKDMNQNDPDSWIRQLLKANPPRKQSLAISFGEQWDPAKQYRVNMPGAIKKPAAPTVKEPAATTVKEPAAPAVKEPATTTKESTVPTGRSLTIKEQLDAKHRRGK